MKSNEEKRMETGTKEEKLGLKMRKRFVWTLALAIGFTLAPCTARSQPTAQPDEIRIVVNDVRNQKGSVICSLWSSANSAEFTTVGTAFRRISFSINA